MTTASWVTLGLSLVVYLVGFVISWGKLGARVGRMEKDIERMLKVLEEQYVRRDVFDTCLDTLREDFQEIKSLNLAARFASIETQQSNIMKGQTKIEAQLSELQKDITMLRERVK